MIHIKLSNPINIQNSKYALLVKFDYKCSILNEIKKCKVRFYHNDDKFWEVSPFEYARLSSTLEEIDEVKYYPSKEEIASRLSDPQITQKHLILKVANPIKQKLNPYSLFISFNFSKEMIETLKELNSFYIPELKAWETEVKNIKTIIEKGRSLSLIPRISENSINIGMSVLKSIDIENCSKSTDWDSILINQEFATKPYSYQYQGIRSALENSSLLLADEQGLGKTLQALYSAHIKSKIEKFPYTLIVCGVNGLKFNWLSEIKEHLHEEGHILGSRINKKGKIVEGTIKDRLANLIELEYGATSNRFIVTNIETLRNPEIKEKLKELCVKGIIGMTILDEIHRVSNTKSSQGDALNYLRSRNKIGITGTPLINKPFDVYAQLKWLGVEKRSEYEFKQAYGVFETNYAHGREYSELTGFTNLDELKDLLKTVMLRREKKDVLDLPDVIYMQEYVELTKEQNKLYNTIRNELAPKIDEIMLDPNPLAKFTRLRQACSCPSAVDKSISKNTKFTRIFEILEDLKSEGKKAIIYSNFTHAVKELNSILLDKGYTSYAVHGEISNKKDVIDKFKLDGDVLVGNVQVLGTGYTITEATTIIFLDLPWTYASMIQAVDRAHRIGQKNMITVVSILAKDSIDEKMYSIVKTKQDIFEDLMEGKDIKNVSRKNLVKSLLGITKADTPPRNKHKEEASDTEIFDFDNTVEYKEEETEFDFSNFQSDLVDFNLV